MIEPWIMLVVLWFKLYINADYGISVIRKVETSKAMEYNIMQQNKSLCIDTIYFNLLNCNKQYH